MAYTTLTVHARDIVGKGLQRLRAEGKIPAILYGHGVTPQNLWVDTLSFHKISENAGESTIIELAKGKGAPVNVLIHDTQIHPISGKVLHIDFFQVKMNESIEADIPVQFDGEAPAVKGLGGTLVKSVDTIAVRCLPADLPQHFPVDLSTLVSFTDRIAIADLIIPERVTILAEMETIVVSVAAPRTDEEMAALDEEVKEDVASVEGVAEVKTKDEGEEDPTAEPQSTPKGEIKPKV